MGLINKHILGTAEFNEWGKKITTSAQNKLVNGTVKAPFPTYHRNALKTLRNSKQLLMSITELIHI